MIGFAKRQRYDGLFLLLALNLKLFALDKGFNLAFIHTNLSSGCTFTKEYDSHIEGVLEVAI
ncbi:MAG: hypothetical protein BRC58_05670 [Cyanobacteria bacterium QS_8_64_29]|nr:MAG: hypothetical protein BRC58_05670 [Cyanobacteria bacterium QS_8_64_29]